MALPRTHSEAEEEDVPNMEEDSPPTQIAPERVKSPAVTTHESLIGKTAQQLGISPETLQSKVKQVPLRTQGARSRTRKIRKPSRFQDFETEL